MKFVPSRLWSDWYVIAAEDDRHFQTLQLKHYVELTGHSFIQLQGKVEQYEGSIASEVPVFEGKGRTEKFIREFIEPNAVAMRMKGNKIDRVFEL